MFRYTGFPAAAFFPHPRCLNLIKLFPAAFGIPAFVAGKAGFAAPFKLGPNLMRRPPRWHMPPVSAYICGVIPANKESR